MMSNNIFSSAAKAEPPVVGKTIIAQRYEPDNFSCWAVLEPEFSKHQDLLEPGVVYEIMEGREGDACYGIVLMSKGISDRDPIAEQLSKGEREPITASVMNLMVVRKSGIVAPVGRHPIRLAVASGIRTAFNIPKDGIPVGVYTLLSGLPPSTGTLYLPSNYVLGPEAAHVNIGGQSGYAKTALALLCCKAILSKEKRTCVIAFNVKATDLLWVDQGNPELNEEDRKLYELLGIEPKPFENHEIFAPGSPEEVDKPFSLRSDGVTIFSWVGKTLKISFIQRFLQRIGMID